MKKDISISPIAVGESNLLYEKEKKRRSLLKRILIVLSAVVVFCTVYSLILPAITMVNEDIAVCGMTEHIHDESCYVSVEKLSFACEGIHKHNATCFAADGSCICGFADYTVHTHNSSCYNAEGKLECPLPEIAEHTHTSACVTADGQYTCGCEAPVYHVHTDLCYNAAGKPVCGKSEVKEAAFHQHSAGCYSGGELVCGHVEILRHAHSDCVSKTKEKALICDIPEHVHTNECLPERSDVITEDGYTCGFGYEHKHADDCYKNGKLVCTLEEHTHSADCLKDMTADRESAAQTKESFSGITLTGDLNKDVLSAAGTQLGYTESEKNFISAENGVKKGYTRYGEWFGDPYADWNALFCSCCLHFAGADKNVMPVSADAGAWMKTAEDAGLIAKKEDYTPVPGDIVFIGSADGETPVRMGFAAEVINKNGISVRLIEGDCDGAVTDGNVYAEEDILCYCRLSGIAARSEAHTVTVSGVTDTGLKVILTAPPSSLPSPTEERTLRVKEVSSETAGRLTDEKLAQDGLTAAQSLYFDIKLLHNGKETEPTGPVSVSIEGIAGEIDRHVIRRDQSI